VGTAFAPLQGSDDGVQVPLLSAIVITDPHMPKDDGFEPIRETKADARCAHAPAPFATAPDRRRAAQRRAWPRQEQGPAADIAGRPPTGGVNGDDPGR
jgi:CheY-like chemotaxis protein